MEDVKSKRHALTPPPKTPVWGFFRSCLIQGLFVVLNYVWSGVSFYCYLTAQKTDPAFYVFWWVFNTAAFVVCSWGTWRTWLFFRYLHAQDAELKAKYEQLQKAVDDLPG